MDSFFTPENGRKEFSKTCDETALEEIIDSNGREMDFGPTSESHAPRGGGLPPFDEV